MNYLVLLLEFSRVPWKADSRKTNYFVWYSVFPLLFDHCLILCLPTSSGPCMILCFPASICPLSDSLFSRLFLTIVWYSVPASLWPSSDSMVSHLFLTFGWFSVSPPLCDPHMILCSPASLQPSSESLFSCLLFTPPDSLFSCLFLAFVWYSIFLLLSGPCLILFSCLFLTLFWHSIYLPLSGPCLVLSWPFSLHLKSCHTCGWGLGCSGTSNGGIINLCHTGKIR